MQCLESEPAWQIRPPAHYEALTLWLRPLCTCGVRVWGGVGWFTALPPGLGSHLSVTYLRDAAMQWGWGLCSLVSGVR